MKGPFKFLVLLAVIFLGLGLWVATQQGGGGLGDEGPAAGGAGGVATPGGADDDAQDRSEGAVAITAKGFEPQTVEVLGDGRVTFINRDDVAHGVDFADDAVKDATRIPPGRSFVVVMPSEGRFEFSDPTADGSGGTVDFSGGG